MKFINRNAYIMCAVYGKNFCTSARDAFFLLMRNALRAFVLDKVTDFLLFMGKLVITGSVAIGSFFIFTHAINLDEKVQDCSKPNLKNFFCLKFKQVLLMNSLCLCSSSHQSSTST